MATADEVIAVAMAQRGKPYVFGAAGPDKFDCSGLVVYAFKNGAGITLPHFTGSLWTKGTQISKAQIAPGDLVFPNPSHVGLAISNTQIVVAPHTGTVVQVQNIGTVWGARRIIAPGTGTVDGGTTETVGLPGAETAMQIAAIFAIFSKINKIAEWTRDRKNWVRIGIGAAGVSLISIGVLRWDAGKAVVQGAGSVVKGSINVGKKVASSVGS